MNIAGLILAGGASRRMGSPKALLDFQGETFLDRLIRLFSAGCTSVTVVLGSGAENIRAGLRAPRETIFVVNADWERGQLTSLQAGLRSVQDHKAPVLFTPVDYPAIQPATIHAICDAWHSTEEKPGFIIPRYEGRHGHPVLCHPDVIADLLALPPSDMARTVIHRYVDGTLYLDVEDPGILRDADDRAAYEALLAKAGPR